MFYLNDFLELEKEFDNFHFHLALDRPDPEADKAGVKYTPGFVHQVMYDTYLKFVDSPEDIEYYMCGPGPMSNAVVKMLDSLGVEPESITVSYTHLTLPTNSLCLSILAIKPKEKYLIFFFGFITFCY